MPVRGHGLDEKARGRLRVALNYLWNAHDRLDKAADEGAGVLDTRTIRSLRDDTYRLIERLAPLVPKEKGGSEGWN